jgi:beta-glucosidase-like glycosyl hydrolase
MRFNMSISPPTALPDKIAQLVFVRLGSNMTPPVTASEDADRVSALLDRYPLGGLLLFNGTFPATADRLAELQARSAFPLLVAADLERGVGQQVDGATVFPHAMALAALDDEAEEAIDSVARATAREALACGIHQLLAPVADVNLHPRNPIISIRAFGTEPAVVTQHVETYVRAVRDEGLITTAKHFPGHGRTVDDTHDTLPVVEATRADLEAADLLPFRAALEAGVDTVMTTHAAFPALDPEGRPATLSPPILRDLLRGRMEFEGPVVTDSMLMAAVQSTHDDPGDQAAALLNAGVDCILDPTDPEAVIEGLIQAVSDGRVAAERVDAAFDRIWRLKMRLAERFGPDVFTMPEQYVDRSVVGSGSHRDLAASVTRRAVTVMGGHALPSPIYGSGGADFLTIYVTPRAREATRGEIPLEDAIRAHAPEATFTAVDADTTPNELDAIRDQATAAHAVLLVLAVTPAAWQRFGLQPMQEQFVNQLSRETRRLIVAALGSPHVLDSVPQASAQLCTYSDVPEAHRALASCVLGPR